VDAPNITPRLLLLTIYQSIGTPGQADLAVEATLQLPEWRPTSASEEHGHEIGKRKPSTSLHRSERDMYGALVMMTDQCGMTPEVCISFHPCLSIAAELWHTTRVVRIGLHRYHLVPVHFTHLYKQPYLHPSSCRTIHQSFAPMGTRAEPDQSLNGSPARLPVHAAVDYF